jgi:hypothetical protein
MMARPDGDQLAVLIQRLADLEAEVRVQQAEIALLRTGVAVPHDTLVVGESSARPAGAAPVAVSPMALPEPLPAMRRKSRRELLKLGGAAAAASVAAVAAGATEPAHPGTAHARADTVGLYSNIDGVGNVAIKGDGGQGAHGVEGTTDSGFGLYGLSFTGNAVYAKSTQGGIAVSAESTSTGGFGVVSSGDRYGVYGSSSSGEGVHGVSASSTGVHGNSALSTGVTGTGNYGGYFSGAAAALVVGKNPNLVGPPNTGNHQKGEMTTDSNGLLWFCINDGTPGTWIRLAGPPSGHAGGAIAYLSVPVRLLDARNGASSGLVNRGPLGPLETYAFTVGGL